MDQFTNDLEYISSVIPEQLRKALAKVVTLDTSQEDTSSVVRDEQLRKVLEKFITLDTSQEETSSVVRDEQLPKA
jgi:UDP-glucose 4-epimerase